MVVEGLELGELPRKKSGRGFEDLIRPAELTILPFELGIGPGFLEDHGLRQRSPRPWAPSA